MFILLVLLLFQTQPDTSKHTHSHVDSLELIESDLKKEFLQVQRIESKLDKLLKFLNSQSYDFIKEAVASSDSTRRDQ